MLEVQDKGRVWLRGNVRPVFALRINSKIVIPGCDEEQCVYWVSGDGLCVDCHQPGTGLRIARWFPLSGEGDTPGTLFSGFDLTKHADILAFVPTSPSVKSVEYEGEDYQRVKDLDSEQFWQFADLEKR